MKIKAVCDMCKKTNVFTNELDVEVDVSDIVLAYCEHCDAINTHEVISIS